LTIGERTQLVDRTGHTRQMSDQDLAGILSKVPRDAHNNYRAIASRYLVGKPVGPRRYHGTRRDDPNDTVPHEHRRDLRGFRVFCAWVNHDDSRAINSLDMVANEGGIPFIRHYLVDFGSTLGSASNGPNSHRSGFEELFSWKSSAKEFFTLGLYAPRWSTARYPNLPSVGRFEYEAFDPEKWTPEYYNAAFNNMLPDDAFWAARQVMAFTGEQIRALVGTGRFSDRRAEEWVTKCLIERRDKIGRAFLSKVLPLDRFRVQEGALRFEDLAQNHGLLEANKHEPRYRVQWAEFDNATGKHSRIAGEGLTIPRMKAAYVMATINTADTSKSVRVYLRQQSGGWDVVGVERTW
jgi:hypothetical protein